ncbi:hypothetical protein KVR01_000068 [Diaporthe batatas]|uniref:uncharacterized protein n=1 Tax=Diaporthe batatas TaxID=748121 RepID=UPI001D0572FA|nr:uncharacterized protein KVR01_000068 [Diaporthe batatas]KAG8169323.1 hypothetical protein KVR01_000068 [Diaporthe batatas]
MLSALFGVALVFFVTPSLALDYTLVQVEHLRSAPSPWAISRPADPGQRFQLSIALDRSRHVEDKLYAVSTPGHESYRKHLTRAEAQAMLSPDSETAAKVKAWLVGNDIDPSDIRDDKHWIRVTATVEKANRMLDSDFAWYKHMGSGKEVLRTLRYSLPQEMRSDISLITPTTRFCSHPMMHQPMTPQASEDATDTLPPDELRRLKTRGFAGTKQRVAQLEAAAQVDPSCNTTITPACVRALYNMPSNLTVSKARGLGVYASQNQVPKFADFALFVKNVDPTSPPTNFSFLSINNATTDQNQNQDSNQELQFDVQYTATLSSPVPNIVTAVTGDGPIQPELGNVPGDSTEPWLIWLDAMLALPDDQLPHTITTSFGENEQSLPDGYVQQICNQFGALGARGVTMFAASGDSGPGNACVSNDGKNSTKFDAVFPGTCPFVTAVGGTRGTNPERALSFSSGGFSERFARPAYQDQAVPAYLNGTIGNQFQGLFNPSGRGFPDVSAQSFNATFADQGAVLVGFAGTS